MTHPIDDQTIMEFDMVQKSHGTRVALTNFYIEVLQQLAIAIPGIQGINFITDKGCTCDFIISKSHGENVLIDPSTPEKWT